MRGGVRFRRRVALRWLLFVAAAGALGVLAFGESRELRVVVPAVEAEEAAALCARSGLSLEDFWDRVKAMGVAAAVLRQKPVRKLVERGEAFYFERGELEKWRTIGLVAPGVTLKPNTLWVKDARLVEQVLDSASQKGMTVTTSTSAGYHLVHLPTAVEEAGLGAYDPELLRVLDGRGLAEVRAATERLSSVGLRWEAGGSVKGFPAAEGPADLKLETRSVPVDAGPAELLRAAYGRPRRLLVFKLSAARGAEENFELLRACLRELSRRGLPLGLPAKPPEEPSQPSPLQAWLIRALLLLFALLGPLFSARTGLIAMKRVRVLAHERWPVVMPVAQLVCGILAAALVAAGVGAAARACFDALPAPPSVDSWAFAALAGPLTIGLLTLFTVDPAGWLERAAKPLTAAALLTAAAVLVAAALILEPRSALQAAGLWDWAGRLEEAPPAFWWATWRWREILVGYPCLLQALYLINWKMDCPDCEAGPSGPASDPRLWFLLGLLAPIGVVVALGRGGVPQVLALEHTAWAAAGGSFLGALGIAWRRRVASRPKGPDSDGTIVLDPQV